MAVMELKHDVVKEFIDRLERQGYSHEYVDGALEGMSFVLEFYQTMIKLQNVKQKLLKEEHNVPA